MHVLLIQVRAPGDLMAEHEVECLVRRIARHDPQVSTRNVFAEIPTRRWLDGVDAVIVGGSGSFSVQDPRSSAFVGPLRDLLEEALGAGMPGFGICFGHQLLGLHLGSTVMTDLERREAGTIELRLTEAGRNDPLFSSFDEVFYGHTGHTDFVTKIPKRTHLLASSGSVAAQAFHVDGTRFYSTQFHPDLTGDDARHRYRWFAGKLPPEEAARVEDDIAAFDPEREDTHDLLERFLDLLDHPPPRKPSGSE